MKKLILYILICGFYWSGCVNLDEAPRTHREHYIKFFDFQHNAIPTHFLPTNDGGFVILANYDNYVETELDQTHKLEPTTFFIKVDALGTVSWQQSYSSLNGKSIIKTDNQFILLCDSVSVNPTSNIRDSIWVKLIKTDETGNILAEKLVFDRNWKSDYNIKGDAAIVHEPDSLVIVGNLVSSIREDEIFIAKINAANLTVRWVKTLTALTQGQSLDYVNGKAVQRTDNDDLIWPAYGTDNTNNASIGIFTTYYPYLPLANIKNSARLGDFTEQLRYEFKDLCKTASGFGTIGTVGSVLGVNKNIVFARLNSTGSLINSSIVFIDVANVQNNGTIETMPTNSVSEDTGEAVAEHPLGGYVLACTTMNPTSGLDICMIRLSAKNEILWTKTFGGEGNEIPVQVKVLPDYSIAVLGQSELKELTAALIIKMDSNGIIEK